MLSYAGALTMTAVADPDHFLKPGTLSDALRTEFDLIIQHPAVRR